MIFQKSFLDKGVEVTIEFYDPYFEEGALRRVRNAKIFVNALKSRGGNYAHRRIAFKEMEWRGDRFHFKGLEVSHSMSPHELDDWGRIMGKMIKEAQIRTHYK